MIARMLLSLPLALLAAPAAAQLWVAVETLPGGIVVELDAESVEQAMDGENLTLRGTFRKELPNAMMETLVAVDCNNQTAKIRGIRLTQQGQLATETISPSAEFRPVGYGSAEAIYLEALCHDEIPEPPEVDPSELDGAMADHEALPEAPADDPANAPE